MNMKKTRETAMAIADVQKAVNHILKRNCDPIHKARQINALGGYLRYKLKTIKES